MNFPSTVIDTGDRGAQAFPIGNAGLPAYRDPSSALTNWGPRPSDGLPAPGSMGRVRATMGEVSNAKITHMYVVQNWTDDSHELVRTGQMVFIETSPSLGAPRRYSSRILPNKIVTWGHLNSIIAKDYGDAMEQLRANAWPNGVTAAVLNKFDERQIARYIGRPDAMNAEISDPAIRKELTNIIDTVADSPYYALFPSLVMRRWNFLGVVNNTSSAESMRNSAPYSSINAGGSAIVANVVVGLKAHTFNVWGPLKITRPVFLICRRARTRDGNYAFPEIVPARGVDYGHTVSGDDTFYEDFMGRPTHGVVMCLGHIGNDSVNTPPSKAKVLQAINSGGSQTPRIAVDAMTVLPQVQLQVGV